VSRELLSESAVVKEGVSLPQRPNGASSATGGADSEWLLHMHSGSANVPSARKRVCSGAVRQSEWGTRVRLPSVTRQIRVLYVTFVLRRRSSRGGLSQTSTFTLTRVN